MKSCESRKPRPIALNRVGYLENAMMVKTDQFLPRTNPNFLLEPGWGDYVGVNSYDAGRAIRRIGPFWKNTLFRHGGET
jgi:hypothetical protein